MSETGNPTLDRLLAKARVVGSERLANFAGTFEGGYYIQQNPWEIAHMTWELMKLQEGKGPWDYLELGVGACGTTRFLDEELNLNKVVLLDNHSHHTWVHIERNTEAIKHEGRLIEWVGDSLSPECRDWLAKLGMMFDLIMVDGAHDEAHVGPDFDTVAPYVKDGGILMFHDSIACAPVAAMVQAIRDGKTSIGPWAFLWTQKHFAPEWQLGISAFKKLPPSVKDSEKEVASSPVLATRSPSHSLAARRGKRR